MAESPVAMDSAFSIPDTKPISNGHTDAVSHDHHLTVPTTNGIARNEPGHFDSFDDSFVNISSSNYDDNEDDFVDELELERIRHLSTIVEGPAENSNSSSDIEDDEENYIRLDEMSVLNRPTKKPDEIDKLPPIQEVRRMHTPPYLFDPEPLSPNTVPNCQEVNPGPHPGDVSAIVSRNDYDEVYLDTPQATSPAPESPTNDYDEVETFHPSTTSPTNSHKLETSPVATRDFTPSCDGGIHQDNTTTHEASVDMLIPGREEAAPSPHGFLAMLSDVLAAPPVLDGDQGIENDGGLMKGTLGLSFPGEWPPSDDQVGMDTFDIEDDSLFILPNFLPLVSHVDSFTGPPISLETPSSQHRGSNSGSESEYVCISDVIELPNRERNGDTAHGNQTTIDNETQAGNTNTEAVPSLQNDTPTTSPKRAANTDVITAANMQATPTQEVSGNLSNASSNLDKGMRRGPRPHSHTPRPLGHTLSSPEGSPVVLRRRLGERESPLARRRNITSSPVQQRGDLEILQPLSPEHGLQLNDQYNLLRRTLSHSHRRYSTRRRPNRKGRSQDQEGPSQEQESGEMDSSIAQSVDVSPPEQQRWRDILISSEVSPTARRSEGSETHVDHHGRTYVMDHRTRTIAFDGQRRRTQHGTTTTSDLDARRQMLDRRYLSLNRSFRRNERPAPSRHNSQRAGLSPSLSNTLEQESNMSLTLTREEADAMLRRGSNSASGSSSSTRSKSKKKRNSSGSGRRWPFSRKSSKSISQQGTSSSGDDILVVSPSPIGGDLEFSIPDASLRSSLSPQRSTSGSVDSESSLTRSSGVNADDRVGVASEQGVIRESGDVVAEIQQGGSEIIESGARHMSPEISDLDRQDSIVRSSWLSGADRTAAQVARRRASTRVSRSQDSEETAIEVSEPHTPASPLSPVDIVVEDDDDDEEVKVKERELSHALSYSPALKFVTRKDLFSFLRSAGEPGKTFIASRALMELVQRIRSDNILLEKYQHSRHLVNALNMFADQEADLPEGWEKKLNQQGKVFFIDHDHKITTFIDPRLPLPDTVFTYTTRAASASISATRRSALFDEHEVRPHHVTRVSTSSSVSELVTPTLDEATPTRDETTPTPSEPDGQASGGPESSSGPPTYQTQVVAFFRRPDVVDVINDRYQRGVRPQFRNIIEEVRLLGVPALERIQLSGSIAAYELALVLSLFEEDIGRIQLTAQNTTAPSLVVTTAQPSPTQPTPNTKKANTLQRKKEAFSTKLQHFKIMMVRLSFAQGSRLKFNIRRDHLLEDAYEHVMKSDIKQLQTKRLNIAFKGEEGLDYGGPSREFFFLLSREIFNPYYGLFEYSANDTYTVQVNPTSEFLQNSIDWFRFAGRVMGLVIVQGFLLDAFFTRTVYKTLLSRPPTLKDLEALEPAFHSSLLWIRENDPEPLDLTFTIEEEAFGELRTHELKEGGLDLLVTEDNKDLYITLMLKWRLDRGVAKQMEVLKKGFAEVMPPPLLVDFDASELEFITAGTVEIDVEDWKTHTEYRNGYHAAHPVIMWFWKAIESFTNEQRLRLLQFVTGTSSVPFEGFKALRGSNGPKRFTVDYFNDVNAFPRTHTCFNRIDLPPYTSYDILFDKVLFAVQEGGGFGME